MLRHSVLFRFRWLLIALRVDRTKMETTSFRVLVTGGGAPGTSGTAHMLNKGAQSDGLQIELFTTDLREQFRAGSEFRKSFQIPTPDSDDYLSALNQIIADVSIDLVIPQTTRESAFLSAHTEKVNAKVAVLPAHHFSLLNDKWALLTAFRDTGLPFTDTALVHSVDEFYEAAREIGFPSIDLVVKPLSSSGMRGVRRISAEHETKEKFLKEKPNSWSISQDDLVAILGSGEWPPLLVMPYLDGPEYSVDVFRRFGKTLVLPRRRSLIRAGISMATELELHEEMVRVVEKFVDALNIEGVLGFQFILRDGVPYVIESNPRVQGTMVASLLSGVNLLWLEVKHHLVLPVADQEFEVVNSTGEFLRTWSGELRYATGEIESI